MGPGDAISESFDDCGLFNVSGQDCFMNSSIKGVLWTSISVGNLEARASAPVTTELHRIFSSKVNCTTQLQSSMQFEVETGALPGIGDDSNRFIQHLVNALIFTYIWKERFPQKMLL